MDDLLLNPYQKASLATVLHMFEEDLRQTDTCLDGGQADGILYRRQLHLSPAWRAVVRQLISSTPDEIATLAGKLGLEQEVEDPAGMIIA